MEGHLQTRMEVWVDNNNYCHMERHLLLSYYYVTELVDHSVLINNVIDSTEAIHTMKKYKHGSGRDVLNGDHIDNNNGKSLPRMKYSSPLTVHNRS